MQAKKSKTDVGILKLSVKVYTVRLKCKNFYLKINKNKMPLT
jgi:hypothetical protein